MQWQGVAVTAVVAGIHGILLAAVLSGSPPPLTVPPKPMRVTLVEASVPEAGPPEAAPAAPETPAAPQAPPPVPSPPTPPVPVAVTEAPPVPADAAETGPATIDTAAAPAPAGAPDPAAMPGPGAPAAALETVSLADGTIRVVYPLVSRRIGEQGLVMLRIHVEADGHISDAAVLRSSGFPRLDRAALDAARAGRMRPATRDGQPVAMSFRLPVQFSLNPSR